MSPTSGHRLPGTTLATATASDPVGTNLLRSLIRETLIQELEISTPEKKPEEKKEVVWQPEWGTKNKWDELYPDVLPSKLIPVKSDELDATFKAKLDAAFAELKKINPAYDPVIWEAGRSQHRQAFLYGKGRPDFKVYGRAGTQVTQTLNSGRHGIYPARAADVVSASKLWSWPEFYKDWGKVAVAQGLRWLGGSKTDTDDGRTDDQRAKDAIGDNPHVELR